MKESLEQCSPTEIPNAQSFTSQRSHSDTRSPFSDAARQRGRPRKYQLQVGKRPTDRSLVTTRRMHNDSAMRSRCRLNSMLDDLWSAVPTAQRVRPKSQSGLNTDHEISRADKIEIAVLYIRKMQEYLKNSVHGASFV